MDFSNNSTASIDYSPTAQAQNVTLVLEEKELAHASHHQIERFLRVWCSDYESAPNLKSLTLVLRPTVYTTVFRIHMEGIQAFVARIRELHTSIPTTVYLDNWSDLCNGVRTKFAEEPVRLM